MENEIREQQKATSQISAKKHLSCILNPLKTGETSKYFKNPRVIRFLKDPRLLAECMLEAIDKLKSEELTPKERIVYVNVLSNVYKALFGSKFRLEPVIGFEEQLEDWLEKRRKLLEEQKIQDK